MKTLHALLLFLFFKTDFVATSAGQGIVLKQSNQSGIYAKGERIQVSVLLKGGG